MKKVFKSILLIGLMIFTTLILCGCEMNDNGSRFKKIKNYLDGFLFYDTETGVEYILKDRGITVLLDADGKPIIYKGE